MAYQVRQQSLQAHPDTPEYLDRHRSERPVLGREQLTRYDEAGQHQTLETDGQVRTGVRRVGVGVGVGVGAKATKHYVVTEMHVTYFP